jgi:hypothetical protein
MFDLHFIHAVKNGIRYYGADRFMFDELFTGVSDNMKARMFQYLQDTDIKFDAAYTGGGAEGLPLVTVELAEAAYDSQGIGNAAFSKFDAEGREYKRVHLYTSQEVRVSIYCKSIESVRIIHRLIQASMLIFHPSFISAGYQNILYMGSTPLEPTIELEGEGLNVYARQIRYAALHLLEVPARIEDLNNIGAVDPLYDIQVALEGTTPEGSTVEGGVAPTSLSDS